MGDILSHGPDRPRRTPPRWLGPVGVVALVVALVVVLAMRGGDGDNADPRQATQPSSPERTETWRTISPVPSPTVRPAQTAAVMLSRRAAFGYTLDRYDPVAGEGPWTVIVRRYGGSLGQHSAVVTFPVHPTNGGLVRVGDVVGRTTPNAVTWPLGGMHARIRGDLPKDQLAAIAAATRVVDGRPRVRAPDGYTVVARGPYRAGHVHEARYGVGELVAAGKLEGLVYTGVVRAGGFEDQLYVSDARASGTVRGHPAVLSSVAGGTATLAWEPAPGVVAYVGYSGVVLDRNAVATLHDLADRTIPLSLAQWRDTDPQRVKRTNDYS